MNIKKLFSIGIISLGLSQPVFSQDPDVAVGQYLPPEKDSVIEIYKCGNKFCGKTICIKDNAYKEKEKDLPKNFDGNVKGEILDKLGLDRICCRRHILAHIDLIDII